MFGEFIGKLPKINNDVILTAFAKTYAVLNNPDTEYKSVICSVSGGSDSDIMLDLIWRTDEAKVVRYVWFDTGLEYQATKDHLQYLEERYGVEIERIRAKKPIPWCVKKHGQPFLSKYVSENISRLQKNGFEFKDESYEDLLRKYPNCKAAIKWWCNRNANDLKDDNGGKSRFNIEWNSYLKEFLVANPPKFKISNKCCHYAKKKVAHDLIEKYDCDLIITGIRKAEGGIRAAKYKNCYTVSEEKVDAYRPLFWFTNNDKREYEEIFGIYHSACYEQYGLKRTGCCCCPYGGRHLQHELKQTKIHEPNLYLAARNIFGDSYEYTKKYRLFQIEMRERGSGQMFMSELWREL